MDLTEQKIGGSYRTSLTTQSYARQLGIEGVRFIDLRVFGDVGGDFCELSRLTPEGTLEEVPGYRPLQVSYSFMEPGTIKAWHLHHRQDDLWFIPPHDRALVGLLDVREDSESYQRTMRFIMGGGKARLLLIPRGVAHGIANLTGRAASMVYFTNTQFDPDHPDEHRLPYDLLGAEFWTNQPG